MALDIAKLLNVKKLAHGETQARCPACAAAGADTKGEHLKIYADGKYSCAANQGDKEHRKDIFKLAGIAAHHDVCMNDIWKVVNGEKLAAKGWALEKSVELAQ